IPIWLPNEFQDPWAAALKGGKRPTVSRNGTGWHIRSYGMGASPAVDSAAPVVLASATGDVIHLKALKPGDFANIPPRQVLYAPPIQRKKLSATIAKGGTGKTTKKVAEGIAMSTCRNILGVQPALRLRVWIHSGEDDMDELRRKVKATCQYFKIPLEELDGWLF